MAIFKYSKESIGRGLFYETVCLAHEVFDELFGFHRSLSFFAFLCVLHNIVVIVNGYYHNIRVRLVHILLDGIVTRIVMKVQDKEGHIVFVKLFGSNIVDTSVYGAYCLSV